MRRILALAMLAALLVTGTAVIVATDSTPAMAGCGGAGC
jgi:hypothetical protein